MKLKHIFLLAAAIITCVAACSSVDSALTVRRTAAGPFTALRSSGPLPVEIRQVPDSAGTVVIEASDRALAHVHVANSDGTLIIDWQRADNVRDYSREVKSIKVYCGTELRQITQTGSGIVNLPALHTQSELTLVNTGSGAIRMGRTDCLNFTGSNTGSGLIKIASLKARNISTSATGSACCSSTPWKPTVSTAPSPAAEWHRSAAMRPKRRSPFAEAACSRPATLKAVP